MAARCVLFDPETGRAEMQRSCITIPYHVWYIYLHERLKFMVNVGRYTWMLWVWRLDDFTSQSFGTRF